MTLQVVEGCTGVLVIEVGEGYGGVQGERGGGGDITKGARRDAEHEVGLGRTIALQVTFELSSEKGQTRDFVGKGFRRGICFFFQKKVLRKKSLVTRTIIS